MTEAKPLAGRGALITGAARRSGRATALALGHDSAAIAVNTRRSADEAESVVAELRERDIKAAAYIADVTDEDAVAHMHGMIAQELGPVDILVNNAADRGRSPTLDLSLEEFRHIVNIVLEGAFLCSRACLPHMIAQSWGPIVNISGVGNYAGFAERVHVHAGKGGLEAMTRSLSHEFAEYGITVNTVSPGTIGGEWAASAGPMPKNSDRLPLVGFEGEPNDVANAVRMLCQPASRYITGQLIHVSGRLYLS